MTLRGLFYWINIMAKKKQSDNQGEEIAKPKSNNVKKAIDKYLEENDYNALIQSVQPLEVLKDRYEFDKSENWKKKPENLKIIAACYRWRGIKSNIAKDLGCTRVTLNKWLDSSEDLKNAYIDSCEYGIDHVESKNNELIDGVLVLDYDFAGKPVVYKRAPDQKAISFFLATKGKTRGYTTKSEMELSGGLKVENITGMEIL